MITIDAAKRMLVAAAVVAVVTDDEELLGRFVSVTTPLWFFASRQTSKPRHQSRTFAGSSA
ncbi:MAG TPA: hypothetical protein VGP25_03975 [Gemmatimonadaceae bacterium]|nr:hypothetical protein [Gemmatimonadaceae bacterium]